VKTEVLSVGTEQKLKKEVMPNQNTTESGQLEVVYAKPGWILQDDK
jgi:hypothetical protein